MFSHKRPHIKEKSKDRRAIDLDPAANEGIMIKRRRYDDNRLKS